MPGPRYVKDFEFSTKDGFTGSATDRATTPVRGYERRRFAKGGVVKSDDGGNALTQRTNATSQLDAESGGKTPLRPGFKKGGRMRKAKGGVVDSKPPKGAGKIMTDILRENAGKPMKAADITAEVSKRAGAAPKTKLAKGGSASKAAAFGRKMAKNC